MEPPTINLSRVYDKISYHLQMYSLPSLSLSRSVISRETAALRTRYSHTVHNNKVLTLDSTQERGPDQRFWCGTRTISLSRSVRVTLSRLITIKDDKLQFNFKPTVSAQSQILPHLITSAGSLTQRNEAERVIKSPEG